MRNFNAEIERRPDIDFRFLFRQVSDHGFVGEVKNPAVFHHYPTMSEGRFGYQVETFKVPGIRMGKTEFSGILKTVASLRATFPPPFDRARVVPDVCPSLKPRAVGTNKMPDWAPAPQVFQPVSHQLSWTNWSVDNEGLLRRLASHRRHRVLDDFPDVGR